MSKSLLYLISKMTALVLPVLYTFITKTSDGGYTVLVILGFSCLFLLGFLLTERFDRKTAFAVLSALTAAVIIFLDRSELFGLLLLTVIETVDVIIERFRETDIIFYAFTAISVGVLVFTVRPATEYGFIGTAAAAVFLILRILTKKLTEYISVVKQQREELEILRKRIINGNAYVKTLKESASLKERSRFAVRIHDKLGHGISGSIILLEAARLDIRNDPERAEKCVDTAIHTLRDSVDDIRLALRQERPDGTAVDIAELKAQLDSFRLDYGIETSLEISGDAAFISPAVMTCIRDNMLEAMTNTLKHSGADKFSLVLNIMNKAIRAELSDNGRPKEFFTKGMGLTAIEERTGRLGGNCIFSARPDGFHIVMIFKQKSAVSG